MRHWTGWHLVGVWCLGLAAEGAVIGLARRPAAPVHGGSAVFTLRSRGAPHAGTPRVLTAPRIWTDSAGAHRPGASAPTRRVRVVGTVSSSTPLRGRGMSLITRAGSGADPRTMLLAVLAATIPAVVGGLTVRWHAVRYPEPPLSPSPGV